MKTKPKPKHPDALLFPQWEKIKANWTEIVLFKGTKDETSVEFCDN